MAECGGLLVLGESLEDSDGRAHAMAAVLPFSSRRGSLSLGYRQAVAQRDGLLVRRGEAVVGHEFHRWQLQASPGSPADPPEASSRKGLWKGLWQLEGWGSPRRQEGWSAPHLHASWLHLHWAGCPQLPLRLAAAAAGSGGA